MDEELVTRGGRDDRCRFGYATELDSRRISR
jgi:hypothetical protein